MRGQSSQMWLSNFPAADGFDLAQATVSHDGSSWTYNLEGGVFKRSGNGNFGTTPVVVGAGVTKEQLLLREDFMVSDTRLNSDLFDANRTNRGLGDRWSLTPLFAAPAQSIPLTCG
jgi:hypothetical protein